MIQWNKDTLESENSIALILTQAEAEWLKRKKLYERLRRKSNISNLVSENDEVIKVALEWYINNMTTGYFAGKAPIYAVNNVIDAKQQGIIKKLLNKLFSNSTDPDELKTLIDYISKNNNDSAEFFDLAFDYFCKTACYETIYENSNNEIIYTRMDALNTIAIYNYETPAKQIGQLRKWEETKSDGNKMMIVELTSQTGKYFYEPTPEDIKKLRQNESKHLQAKWDELPCIAVENEHGLACFELVISVICAYERAVQNTKDTFKYNDDAKLKITGYSPDEPLMIEKKNGKGEIEVDSFGNPVMTINPARTREEESQLKAKVFYTPDTSGDIAWVEKDVKDTALQNHKKTLIDLISMITGVPNITDLGFTQADNASALDRKFFALEQYVTDADKHFKEQLLRRWKLILDKINKKKHTNYDYKDIKVTLNRNLPTDKKTETDRAMQLRGLLADETIINMLPDELDSKIEIDKINTQNQENMSKNIENMQILGQDMSNTNNTNTNKDDLNNKQPDELIDKE